MIMYNSIDSSCDLEKVNFFKVLVHKDKEYPFSLVAVFDNCSVELCTFGSYRDATRHHQKLLDFLEEQGIMLVNEKLINNF